MLITDVAQVTPDWLTKILNSDRPGKAIVTDIQVLDSRTTHVSTVYKLAVRFTEANADYPTRLFLKLSNPDFQWNDDKEIVFYRDIMARLTGNSRSWINVPCYSVGYDPITKRSHLLLQDLSETYFARSEIEQPTVRHYEWGIDGLAALHGYWWEHPLLGVQIGERLTEKDVRGAEENAQRSCAAFLDFMDSRLSEAQRAILAQATMHWPDRRRARVIAGQGITLVHRDLHPGNFLYRRNRPETVIIDWQSWRVDTGTDDLAYMMACHWEAEQRATLELGLLKRYHEGLIAHDVKGYDWHDLWYDYKASIVRCLSFLIRAWSPAQWERQWWWQRLQRGMLAFEQFHCENIL